MTTAAVALALTAALAFLPGLQSTMVVRSLIFLLLAGYAFLGRTFAYLGVPPVFVGEIALGLVLVVSLLNGSLLRQLRHKLVWALIAFCCWGAMRTIPYLTTYGIDALRDATIWGYSAFAIVVAGMLPPHQRLTAVTDCYRKLLPVYTTWVVLVWVLSQAWPSSVSGLWQGSGGILQTKPGDVSVHLAGIGSFVILGLHRRPDHGGRPVWLKEWFLWGCWTVGVLVYGSYNRGGLLSILVALSVVLVLWLRGRWVKMAVVALCGFALLLSLNLEVDVGASRVISPRQLVSNLLSITGEGALGSERTRGWRINWWRAILDYTISGEYYWTGKGYGVNLADEDGFQTDPRRPLRSPHNGHLTVLARSGVPGLVLWLLLQGSMVLGLLRSFFVARRQGDRAWAGTILWVLAYLVAAGVNSAFDVYLEGPQGGIWFWTIFGMGLSIMAGQGLRRGWGPPAVRLNKTSFAHAV